MKVTVLDSEPSNYSDGSLHGLLRGHALSRPESMALKDPANREALLGSPPSQLTWAELERVSDAFAHVLARRGVKEGDRLLVQLPNIIELAALYYAASKLGAVLSPIPVQYGRFEIQSLAANLGVSLVVSTERVGAVSLAATIRQAVPGIDLLLVGEDLLLATDDGIDSFPAVAPDPERLLTICWTSGTTGTPKGVPRSHAMWAAAGQCSAEAGGMQPEDILLNPFPLVNMAALGGFLYPSALLGCSLVLHHPLDVPLYLQQLQDERVSFTIAPPALLNQLAKAPELWGQFDFGALRRIGSGSAPLAPWMIEVFGREYGKEIVNFYGSNEGICLFATPETAPEPEVRAAMFRRPEAGALIQSRVVNTDSGDEIVRPGEAGELLIAGPTVFKGYFEHDNSGLFTRDGYFRTGDLVEICGEDGSYYRIGGRCKDIINRGGMKVSPAELDIALDKHPCLAEAAVCAYADERLGEKICACLVPVEGQELPALAELQSWLLEQGLAKFKLPERIEEFTQLPRNPLGKVQRFTLQDEVAGRKEIKT